MADAGVASRRECEKMIEDGRVAVNGKTVSSLPVFVHPGEDRVLVDGRPLETSDRGTQRVYVILNKPDNTLGTTKDQLEYAKGGRRTVTDLVKHHSGARLYPVGRLDFHSTGLVLMTNDGVLTERLTHARYGVGKTYRVWITNRVTPQILEMLRRRVGKRDATDAEGRSTGGVRIVTSESEERAQGSRQAHPPHFSMADRESAGLGERGTTVLEIQAREGKTEALDEMLVAVGCRVKRIARVAIGPLRLVGVRPGDWRDLTKDEVRSLMEAAGLSENGGSTSRAQRNGHPKGARSHERGASSTDEQGPEDGL